MLRGGETCHRLTVLPEGTKLLEPRLYQGGYLVIREGTIHGTHEEYLVVPRRVPYVPMKNTLWLWGGRLVAQRWEGGLLILLRMPYGPHGWHSVVQGRVPHAAREGISWFQGGCLTVPMKNTLWLGGIGRGSFVR